MNYQVAISLIQDLGHEQLAMRPGLERISRILDSLGHPETAYPSVIVAGTNGKGSVAAMIEAVLRTANIRAGLYTSPHLVRPEERICVSGRFISQEEFAATATRVFGGVEALLRRGEILTPPSFFEVLTAMAVDYFRDQRIDVAVLEVGLGGRLDATNAAPAFLTVITSIDLDHEKHLGTTLEAIAAEKAATIKPGCRAVVAEQTPEVLDVIRRRCREVGVEPVLVGSDRMEPVLQGIDRDGHRVVDLRTSSGVIQRVVLGLRGAHQVENAIAAAEACVQLRAFGYEVSEADIRVGLARVKWPGRMEVLVPVVGVWPFEESGSVGSFFGEECFLQAEARGLVCRNREALVGGASEMDCRAERQTEVCATSVGVTSPALLLDGAHNPAAARMLRVLLEELHPRYLTLVFGVMRDKKIEAMARELFPLADQRVLTRVEDERAADFSALRGVAQAYGPFIWSDSPEEGLRRALELTPPEGLICVTGSLYLVGAVKAVLEAMRDNQSTLACSPRYL